MSTQVAPAGKAVSAAPTDDVPLATDDLSREKIDDVRPDLDNLADELVADDHRYRDCLLRPRIPAVDMDVGSADGGTLDPHEDVVDPDRRDRDVLEPESGFSVFLD